MSIGDLLGSLQIGLNAGGSGSGAPDGATQAMQQAEKLAQSGNKSQPGQHDVDFLQTIGQLLGVGAGRDKAEGLAPGTTPSQVSSQPLPNVTTTPLTTSSGAGPLDDQQFATSQAAAAQAITGDNAQTQAAKASKGDSNGSGGLGELLKLVTSIFSGG